MELKNKINFLEGYTEKATIMCVDSEQGDKLYFFAPSEMAKFRINTLFTKEPSTISWLNRIKKTDTFLDIGANILSGSNLNDLKQALTLDLQHFEPSNVYGLGNTANKIRKILKSL